MPEQVNNSYGTIISLNIYGLYTTKNKTKPKELQYLASEHNAYIIALNETWLEESILDAEISINNYNLYRSDRKNRSRGGVCCYIRNDIAVSPAQSYSDGTIEYIMLKISTLDTILINLYRPPSTNPQQWAQAIQNIDNEIKTIQNSGKFNNILMVGDFNMPQIDWSLNHGGIPTNSQSRNNVQSIKLFELMEDHFLDQIIHEPTRNNSIIDLLMTNNHHMVCDYSIIVNSKLSDHNTIISVLNFTIDQNSEKNSSDDLFSLLDFLDFGEVFDLS